MRTDCKNCGCDKVIVSNVGTDEQIAKCLNCNSMVDYFAYDSWIDKDIDKKTVEKMTEVLRKKGAAPYCYCDDCSAPLYIVRVDANTVEPALWSKPARTGKILCNSCVDKVEGWT